MVGELVGDAKQVQLFFAVGPLLVLGPAAAVAAELYADAGPRAADRTATGRRNSAPRREGQQIREGDFQGGSDATESGRRRLDPSILDA